MLGYISSRVAQGELGGAVSLGIASFSTPHPSPLPRRANYNAFNIILASLYLVFSYPSFLSLTAPILPGNYSFFIIRG